MFKLLARLGLTVFGAIVGPVLILGLNNLLRSVGSQDLAQWFTPGTMLAIYIASAVVFAIIFFILAPVVITSLTKFTKRMEATLSDMPMADVLFGALGLIIGLVIALLLSSLVQRVPLYWLSVLLSIIVYVMFGYLGWTIAVKRRSELNPTTLFRRLNRGDKGSKVSSYSRPKVLDTSVVIDGRILDICKTGFIEGDLIVPGFVLQELRHIADSADTIKRNRGRRGLEILNGLQKLEGLALLIEDKDYDDIEDVDVKLLRLAGDISGVVVTNDYNLNRVAQVQGVPVFNINELSNAVKSVLLPGEELSVQIIKDGKEPGQGIAYLDDGTMIVVDGGRRHVGEDINVLVTSVLQTSAGKMVFAKINESA